MNARYIILLSLLFGASGCSQSPSANSSTDFTDPNAQFSGNVSETYAMTTISAAPGFDLKWKDSNGIVRSVVGYHDTVVLVTFWRTSDPNSDVMLRVFDSVAADFPDSTRIVMVDDDNSTNRFMDAYKYDTTNHFRSQVLVDSAWRAHQRFAGFLDGQLYYSETFVVQPNGNVKTGNGIVLGWSPPKDVSPATAGPRVFFDSIVRAAYR